MTSRDYGIRLLKLAGLFLAIPILVIAALMLIESMPGWRNSTLGVAYIAFFIGIPAWFIALAISLTRATFARMRSLRLPAAIALGFIPLVLADWQSFAFGWLFRPFQAGAAMMLVALVFWPEPGLHSSAPSRSAANAKRAALWAFAVHVILACASLIGFAMFFGTLARAGFLLQQGSKALAVCSLLILVGTVIWIIVEARRSSNSGSSPPNTKSNYGREPAPPSTAPVFGRRYRS